jgi:hypothetical protein
MLVLRKTKLIGGIKTWKITQAGLDYPDVKRADYLMNKSIKLNIYKPYGYKKSQAISESVK